MKNIKDIWDTFIHFLRLHGCYFYHVAHFTLNYNKQQNWTFLYGCMEKLLSIAMISFLLKHQFVKQFYKLIDSEGATRHINLIAKIHSS